MLTNALKNHMSSLLFSIITVNKNMLQGVQKTHNSIEDQTFSEFEWIVVDGASNDGSVDYLKETHADLVSEPDRGIYDAMNKGIERANGLYVLFLNAGDQLAHSEVLQDLAGYISERGLLPDFIYGDSYEDMPGGVPHYKQARPYKKIDLGMFTHHQAMLYRLNTLNEQKLRYSTRYWIAGDYEFTCRFLKKTDHALYWPSPICLFESGGISQRDARLGRREQFKIKRKLRLCSPIKAQLIYMAQAFASFIKAAFPNFYWSLKGR